MFQVARAGTSGRSPIMRVAAVALVACAATLLIATPARAHNVLIGSDPRQGAVLATMPGKVTLTFDQAVRRDFARIAVTGPDGARYEQGDVGVSGNGIFVALRGQGPSGTYSIGYRIVSNDGHPVTGTVSFAVGNATTGQTGASGGLPGPGTTMGPATGGIVASGVAPPVSASSGAWVWGLLAATAALLALAAFGLIRHDRRVGSGA
ncbi:hypothetical protein GCM10023194_22030 [Planotetraspora phitsanulokensis]|uniref:CopC domain-containing protein n=1 Tax=Planotetraspora phitsanulokensis TaxID=575192 RepID=A0A8J3U4V6_9ACTN|nr:copper resistance CopC family protein [Planotetraspora phitsanulokensis]GII38260.1 hypothetical protein Pph01_32630 [Planotetraspora phitsanulokensis]